MGKKKLKPELTDEELFNLAAANAEYESEIEKMTAKLIKRKAKVITELEARKTQAIEHGGYRINGVWANDTWIDEPGLLLDLSPALRKKITVRKLDRKRLSQAVQSGEIDSVLLKNHTGTKPKRPYYRFTKIDKKGKK